ncbi:MAG: T9SS type A sorting domain-containing protein [Chitinophagales bacterium]|nr:T9SS type A sorting domain-containing protein [Chitinophagales bacterium]
MKKIIPVIAFLFVTAIVWAQVVITYPVFPTVNDTLTVTYNAAEGNGALKGYTGDVYAHTGLLTSQGSGWQHVGDVWGTADSMFLMTRIGTDLYTITFQIRSFYGVNAGEIVYSMAFVFRNTDGTLVGRNTNGSDIFYDVWDGISLESKLLTPDESALSVNFGDTIPVMFASSQLSTISFYQNNILIQQFLNSDSVGYTLIANAYGATWIKAVADDGAQQSSDSFYYFIPPPVTVAPLPAGVDDGINYVDDSTATLVLVAPKKKYVYAIGDFSNWLIDDSMYMKMTPDSSRWWVTLHHLIPLKEYTYQYLVDGTLYIADPYSDKILDPDNDPYISSVTYPNLLPYPTGKATGIVSVLETGQPAYEWQVSSYKRPDKTNLVIYELLIRDFISAHDYHTLKDSLPYLQQLGINAIELMPVSEFEGNVSWGYNPDFYFAPDKYYGPKDSLKSFIDACHALGIAVIQDIVLNHSCEQSPMVQLYWDAVNNRSSADNPWYNPVAKHPFNVCYDFNHESEYTKNFTKDVLKYWAEEYKIDGWRFDLAKGFTQFYSGDDLNLWNKYDQSRVNIWEDYNNFIRSIDSNLYVILEYFADNDEEKVLAGQGMMLWGNLAYNYQQAAMGYSQNDFSWISYKSRRYDSAYVVGYMESHDEERLTYKVETYGNHTVTYDVRPLDSALTRMKLAAAFFIPVPGPKLIWQFGELGYDYPINYCPDGTISDYCRTDPKPIKWDYLNYGPRRWVYNFYAALIHLKETYPVFRTADYSMQVSSFLKSIHLNDSSFNVCILGNFDVYPGSITPAFQKAGTWYEYFTGDSLSITDVNAPLAFASGEYRFYTSIRLAMPDLGNVGIDDPAQTHTLALFRNFPNPFNNNTTIDFYIPEGGKARIELLDLQGQILKLIADRNFIKGYYTVELSADDFSNGIYFCKLTSGGSSKTIKIVVDK